MKLKNGISALWIFIGFIHVSLAQEPTPNNEVFVNPIGDNGWRVMFYNVENFFDTFDDPAIDDDEFKPAGDKHWTYYRYKEKLNNIAKTSIAVGGWEAPAIIGLCEIENFQVLLDLTLDTPLKKFGYQIIHENSQDLRGIDNAILYLPDKLKKIDHHSIQVDTKEKFKTRDILYASFSFIEMDTIHFFVNHWPSRFGGKEFTEEKRLLAAKSLRTKVDSLLFIYSGPKIFILEDFI